MALLNTSLPNLIGGVSQQPDSVRFEGQCEEQTNAISSVVDGLSKRPHTNHIARLISSAINSNSFVHFINRDDNERYVVIHDTQKLRVYNLNNGNQESIIYNGTTHTDGVLGSDISYIHTGIPSTKLKAITIADNTIIINNAITITEGSSSSPSIASEALIFITQGDFEKEYGFEVKVGSTTYKKVFKSGDSTDGNNASSKTILDGVKLLNTFAYSSQSGTTNPQHQGTSTTLPSSIDIPSGNDFSDNNLLILQVASSFDIKPVDGLAGTGIGIVYKEVGSITDLPLFAKNGFEVKVSGDPDLNQDDYYVKFETTSGEAVGKGTWVECLAPNIKLGYTTSTLPLELISTGSGFTLRSMAFADRVAGDNDSNPLASFKDKKISNIFFFKNRLGFLSDENVIMSESGFGAVDETQTPKQTKFNFSRTTVTTLLDSDPIDVSVTSGRVTNLKSATGFQENLIVFSENGQFVLKGGDILTPRTVSITPITNFDSDSAVDPIALGAYIYFPYNRSGFTGVREYTVNASTDVYDSTEITEHIPRYIPSDVIAFSGTTSEDAIVFVSNNDKSTAYVYRFFFNGQKKLLSSWFKFTFDGEIRGLSFIKSELFLVLVKNSETHIASMAFDAGLVDTGVNHNTYLDLRRQVSVAAGASTIDLSSFYTPADNTVKVLSTDGAVIKATNSGATVTLTDGALSSSSSTNVFVGIPYTMTYTFSKQLFKQASGQSKSPSAGGTMQLKSCSIFYNNSAHFQVKVTPISRDTYVNNFSTDVIDVTNIGLNLDDGFFRVPVFSNAEDTTITIENSSALPSHFQSAEFEVNAHQRSRRF